MLDLYELNQLENWSLIFSLKLHSHAFRQMTDQLMDFNLNGYKRNN